MYQNTGNPGEQGTHPYEHITSLLSEGRIGEAVAKLEQQLRQSAIYCNDLGVLCHQNGSPDEAVGHYRNAVALNPDNTTFKKNLADFLCVERGDYQAGLDIYLELFHQDPDDEVREALGIICERLGTRLDHVLATRSAPSDRGEIAEAGCSDNNDAVPFGTVQEEALPRIHQLERSLQEEPGNAVSYNDLGVLYHQQGDTEKSLFCYEKAVELSPQNTTFKKNLADFYFVVADRKEEALRIYADLLAENPTDIDTLLSIGTMCKLLGNLKDALFFHQKVIALEPCNADAWGFMEELIDLRLAETTSTDDPPAVSVIIPLYNAVEYTKRCLASLEATLQPECYELVIVDNNSTDGTAELLSALPSTVKILRNSENVGFAKACNQGAQMASGKYLLFLNNDTEAKEGWLEPLLQTAEQDPSIGAVGSRLLFPDGTIQHAGVLVIEDRQLPDLLVARHVFYGQPADMPQANLPREYQVLTAACLLVRKQAFDAVDGFDEEYWNGYEDIDLCFKLSERQWRLIYQPASQLVHHESKSGAERFNKVDHNIRRLHDKWLGKVVPDIIISEDGEARWAADAAALQAKAAESPSASREQDCTGYQRVVASIVILTCNQLKFTKECLESIQRHTPEPHELIFVDNGSTDGTVAWLKLQTEKAGNIRTIENSSNLGFAKGCNQGIEASRGEFIMLLNNDVIVTEGWLGGMLECLRHERNTGIVGPMTNNISGTQKVPEAPYEDVSAIDTFAGDFRSRFRHRRITQRRIVGFCMLFRRALVERIGLLDESFGSGNFEDDDFCLRSELEGFRNAVAGDVFIHHAGSATFKGNNIDFANAMSGNMKLFNDKWSRPVTDEQEALKIVVLKTLEKAEAQYQRGETDKAIETLLQEGIRKAAEEKRFYYALAEYFIDQERYKDALETLLELPGPCVEPREMVLRGRALAGLARLEEAEAMGKSALESDPSNAQALALLGRIAYDRGQRDEAVSRFEQAMNADPGYGEPYTCLGLIALQEERTAQSVELLEQGFLRSPLSAEAAHHYHSIITGSGDFLRGENTFRETRRFYPQHRTIAFLLIDLLIRQGNYSQAVEEIERACSVFGFEDGMLAAGLDLRRQIGPKSVAPEKKAAGTAVSLCMIVKDEERNLPRCLNSLKPVVDEIIIVDTGSSDRSRNVSELFGARVFDHSWCADFSAARNAGLKEATGNWILVMDADEVLSFLDYDRFRRMIADSAGKRVAFDMVTRNYLSKINVEKWHQNDSLYPHQEAGAGWTPSSKVRMFPNMKGIRFHNAIHEMVDASLSKERIAVRETSIPVHHYGYLDEERQKRKGEQYYQLGKKKLSETGEDDIKALSELAIQAGDIGRYEEAIELWDKVIAMNPSLALAYFNRGFVYLQMGKFRESRDASARAMKLKGDYYEAVNNFTMAELCLGNLQEAIKALEKTLSEKPDYPNAIAMLAVVRLCTGDRNEGLDLLQNLSHRGVVFTEFVNESAKKLRMAGKAEHAAMLLDAVIESGYCTNETVTLQQAS
jgi:GT2 family glycosyltransferase/Flp pilus assembly protein TadD